MARPLSQYTAITFLSNINRLAFCMETQCIFCGVGTIIIIIIIAKRKLFLETGRIASVQNLGVQQKFTFPQ
jgi:hypothetical protein